MNVIVWSQPNGVLAVCIPSDGAAIDEVVARDVPAGAAWRVVDPATFPVAMTDPLFDAVRLTGDGRFVVDPDSLPVPSTVTPYQLRVALRHAGKLQAVEDWVARQAPEIQDAWEYGLDRPIDHPLIRACAVACGLDLPALFRAAGRIG